MSSKKESDKVTKGGNAGGAQTREDGFRSWAIGFGCKIKEAVGETLRRYPLSLWLCNTSETGMRY